MSALLVVVHPHLNAIILSFVGIGACTVIVILFMRRLELRVQELSEEHEDVQGRIIGLEVKEYSQDTRLDSHESTLEAHAKFMVQTQREVDDVGRDIGWEDGKRKTQVMLPSTTQNLLSETKKPKE